MQLLSRILGAKKAADAHNAAASTPPASQQEEIPYRHIPTHALSDSMALGGNMPTADFHERIIAENRRHSQKPPSLRRTGSETFLEYRSEMARQRSARDLARLAAEQDGGDKADGWEKGKAKVNLSLPMPPTSNPYAMPAALQSPKRGGGRSPLGTKKGSPVPSMLSVSSPMVESIAEEIEDPMVTAPERMVVSKKDGGREEVDGYFPVQK